MSRSFGSDPELLVTKNGKPYSAIGLLKGDAKNRTAIKGHEFYYDNVLAECAIKPGKDKKEVIANIKECLQIYADLVKPFKLVLQASTQFPDDQLNHPDARKVNCSKDNCAYELIEKEGPVDAIKNGNLRSCGGHIHLGAKILRGKGAEPILALYVLDLLLGIPSLWLDKDTTSQARRSLYGQAGRYRTKKYGLEYRSLGNFWLSSPEMTGLIYDLAMHSLDLVENKKAWELWDFSWDRFFESDDGSMAAAWECKAYNPKDIQECINRGNKKQAKPLMELAQKYMTKGLEKDLKKQIANNAAINLYTNWKI